MKILISFARINCYLMSDFDGNIVVESRNPVSFFYLLIVDPECYLSPLKKTWARPCFIWGSYSAICLNQTSRWDIN